MISGIYAIRCTLTGQMYIGSSVNIGERLKTHLRRLKQGNHWNFKLQTAFSLHSLHFVTGIVEACSKEQLHEREQHFIDLFQSCGEGFNLAAVVGGAFNRGRKFSLEHRARISRATIRRYEHEEERIKTGEALRKVWADPDSRPIQKIDSEQRRATALALWRDPAFREKVVENLRASITPEVRQKISSGNTGKHRTEEHRQNSSKAALKRYESAEAREVTKIALNRPEVHAKHSEAMRLRWQDPEYRERVLASRKKGSNGIE